MKRLILLFIFIILVFVTCTKGIADAVNDDCYAHLDYRNTLINKQPITQSNIDWIRNVEKRITLDPTRQNYPRPLKLNFLAIWNDVNGDGIITISQFVEHPTRGLITAMDSAGNYICPSVTFKMRDYRRQ